MLTLKCKKILVYKGVTMEEKIKAIIAEIEELGSISEAGKNKQATVKSGRIIKKIKKLMAEIKKNGNKVEVDS